MSDEPTGPERRAGDDGFGPVMRGGGQGDDRADPGSPRAAKAPAHSPPPDDAGFGPPTRRRRAGGGAARAGRVLLAVLLIALLAVTGTVLALVVYTSASIDRVEVSGLSPASGRMNILLVGSDSRQGLTPEQRRTLRTGTAEGARADTIILLSISGGDAAMLSFPRDLWATRCDGTQGRLNSAYPLDGPSCLVQTVTRLSGIPVTHYAEVEFLGFVDLVDAVGGVDIYLDEPIEDPRAALDLPAGCNRLDGAAALGFVRTRAPDSDLGRIARQQRLLAEVAREATAPANLVNVPRLFSTAGAAGRSVTADHGFGIIDMFRVARAARGIAGSGATHVVPASGATVGDAQVLVADDPAAQDLFARFRDGSVIGRGEPAPPPDPGEVELVVLNGAGISGLAGETAEALTDRGFNVVDIGNAPTVERSVVRHPPGAADEAAFVADHVPGASTEETTDVDAVTVVLGTDSQRPANDRPAVQQEPEEEPESDDEPPPAPAESSEPPEDAVGAGTPADC